MAENTEKAVQKTQKTKKKSWFEGMKAEFKKIIWPDKKTLGKQTAAVVTASVVLGAIIAVMDFIIQYGIDFLVK
ncbi:MAG: preprotein translocase subunit SecE [Eubacteriales bacterium]|nr:preprotein translocase subunit SecE [Eubacteriales bacterium]